MLDFPRPCVSTDLGPWLWLITVCVTQVWLLFYGHGLHLWNWALHFFFLHLQNLLQQQLKGAVWYCTL